MNRTLEILAWLFAVGHDPLYFAIYYFFQRVGWAKHKKSIEDRLVACEAALNMKESK